LENLKIDWKPLYNLFQKQMKNPRFFSKSFHWSLVMCLKRLVAECRPYFSPSKSLISQLCSDLRARLSIHSKESFLQLCLFTIFFPSNLFVSEQGENFRPFLEEIIQIWTWFDNGDWDLCWLNIISRLVKAASLNPQTNLVAQVRDLLPLIYAQITRIQGLSTGTAKMRTVRKQSFPMEYRIFLPFLHHRKGNLKARMMSKIIAYTLEPVPSRPSVQQPENSSFKLLSVLMNSIKSYYHPSNSGQWASDLATFLHSLTYYFAKRIKTRSLNTLDMKI